MYQEKKDPKFSKILYLVDILNKVLPYQLVKKIILINFDCLSTNYSNIGILDKSKIYFNDVKVSHAHMIGSTVSSPSNELSVSTFDNNITLSFSSYGSSNNEKIFNTILKDIVDEILSVC